MLPELHAVLRRHSAGLAVRPHRVAAALAASLRPDDHHAVLLVLLALLRRLSLPTMPYEAPTLKTLRTRALC